MTFGARGSSSSQRQKRDPLAWNCCILPYLLCLLPQWRLNAFFQFVDNFYASIRSSLSAETIDMLVFTKYFILRHKYNSIFTYLEYVFTQNYQLYIIYAITMFNEHICLTGQHHHSPLYLGLIRSGSQI